MKRIKVWIAGAALLLAACAAPMNERLVETSAVPAQQETVQAPAPVSTQPPAASQPSPAEEAALPVPDTGADEIDAKPVLTAIVDVDGLNLRVGPGLNHRILGVLPMGTQVQAQGRSVDSGWVAVRLADGREGWLFGAYLKSDADFTALPVMEAYGGPLAEQVQPAAAVNLPGRYTLYMTIADNIATVSMTDFPAGSEVSLRLSVRGEGPSMTVASGRMDSNGAAVIVFEMPRYWPDGSRITQTELKLVAVSAGGAVSRSASIVYYPGE